MIKGDEFSLIRAFNNVISNALKFTPTGGSVKISFQKDDFYHVVQVADTGDGIPQDKLNLILKNYTMYSTPGTNGEVGTGLGVSIAKSVVENNKGIFNIISSMEKGTIITIKLPKYVD